MSWGKLICSFYDEETGQSWADYETKYGIIHTEAKCHPDDMDIVNQWDAWKICGLRGFLEFERLNVIALKERYIAAESILDTIAWNYEGDIIDDLARQAKAACRRYQEARKRYKEHKQNIAGTINIIVKMRRFVREKNIDKS